MDLKDLNGRLGTVLLMELLELYENSEDINLKLWCMELIVEVGVNLDQLNSI